MSTWGKARALLIFFFFFHIPFVFAQISVTTHHNDNSRTGANTHETILKPANVNSSQFGKLFSLPVDGKISAQPLVLSQMDIDGESGNVVFVATEHNGLYAIDGDNGSIFWQISFNNPSQEITSVPSASVHCKDTVPEYGITATPVIDPDSGVLYVVSNTIEKGEVNVQRLHAIDVRTGSEISGSPVKIEARVTVFGNQGETEEIQFDSKLQMARAGLALVSGHVIVTFGAHCDRGSYHGWVMAYDSSTLDLEGVANISPRHGRGGIWQAGGGIAADDEGIYLATGDGYFNGKDSFGDCVVKLGYPVDGTLPVLDFFAPYDQAHLARSDGDLGSGGVLLVPGIDAATTSSKFSSKLLIQGGKEGTLYIIDREKLGHGCDGCDSNTHIVQELRNATKGIWGIPAYWKKNIYLGGSSLNQRTPDSLKAYPIRSDRFVPVNLLPSSQSLNRFGFPAPSPSVSSNGDTDGIIWALENSSSESENGCAVLYAYDAEDLSKLLYSSDQAPERRDMLGGAVKFTSPTVANGRVYVGGQTSLTAFGLLRPEKQEQSEASPARFHHTAGN